MEIKNNNEKPIKKIWKKFKKRSHEVTVRAFVSHDDGDDAVHRIHLYLPNGEMRIEPARPYMHLNTDASKFRVLSLEL